LGSTVKVHDLETDKNISYRLVGQDEADINKNLIFFKSPIGKALIGKIKGEMISVTTPSGERNFEILDVEYI
jgi:Transcription elongation factor